MELTEEDVLRILALIDKSNFDFFQLETGDLKLTVRRGGSGDDAPGADPATPRPEEPSRAAEPPAAPEPQTAEATLPATGAGGPQEADLAGLLPVKAPMVGTFYAAPEPGAPPFVRVGTPVEEDTAVGLIEVMKVFSSVRAGVRGVVDKMLVANGQFVEYGQTLLLVRPEEPAAGERASH